MSSQTPVAATTAIASQTRPSSLHRARASQGEMHKQFHTRTQLCARAHTHSRTHALTHSLTHTCMLPPPPPSCHALGGCSVTSGDLDGDGDVDVVFACQLDNNLQVGLQQPNSSIQFLLIDERVRRVFYMGIAGALLSWALQGYWEEQCCFSFLFSARTLHSPLPV